MPRPLTDEQAALVEANRRLAHKFAKLAHKRYGHLSEDDLVGAAMVGLCRAVAKFDPSKGKLSTFAWDYMRSETQACLRETPLIWTPAYTYSTCNSKPAIHAPHARSVRAMARHSIGENLDVAAIAPHEIDDDTEHHSTQIHRAMELLSPRHHEVFRRIVIDGETLYAVGRDIGVTKERVRQIKSEAIDELRSLMRVKETMINNKERT